MMTDNTAMARRPSRSARYVRVFCANGIRICSQTHDSTPDSSPTVLQVARHDRSLAGHMIRSEYDEERLVRPPYRSYLSAHLAGPCLLPPSTIMISTFPLALQLNGFRALVPKRPPPLASPARLSGSQ